MADLSTGLFLICLMFLLLGMGVWVALALLACGLAAIALFTASPPDIIFASTTWTATANWTLTSLPLFIWMGEILFRTRLSEDMFRGLAPWVRGLPGRLVHINVLGCGLFAAISGSSAATTATIGRISLPELRGRGYDEGLSIGSLAGAGTLGLLIPPSIIMIVYGVAAQVSIGRLFIAGVLPGIMLMILFSGHIALWSLRHRDRCPQDDEAVPLIERVKRLRLLLPTAFLIVAVIGSIYAGIATPTEAAALGVAGALLVAALSRSLSWASFWESLTAAARTSCMITFILAGAAFLTSGMSFTGVPGNLAAWVASLHLSQYELLAALTVLFIVLGCFIDGISIVVLTSSVILPTVVAAGVDLVWFGIYLVLVVEIAQITPPVGFNLYVIQRLTGRDIFTIARMAVPSFVLMVAAMAIIILFPGMVLLLPSLAF
jgi:tripartite ATP-independent transporter DctM subunit